MASSWRRLSRIRRIRSCSRSSAESAAIFLSRILLAGLAAFSFSSICRAFMRFSWILRCISRARASFLPSSSPRTSRISVTASSAAAEGVGARRSDTKSMIVVSVSWPTAEMMGTEQSNTAWATSLSLKAHRSSMEPPPRPTIITSTPNASSARMPLTMLPTAASPCTMAGYRMICTYGFLLPATWMMSRTAAPVSAVTTPKVLMNLGMGCLYSRANMPDSSSSRFSISNRSYSCPLPSSIICFAYS